VALFRSQFGPQDGNLYIRDSEDGPGPKSGQVVWKNTFFLSLNRCKYGYVHRNWTNLVSKWAYQGKLYFENQLGHLGFGLHFQNGRQISAKNDIFNVLRYYNNNTNNWTSFFDKNSCFHILGGHIEILAAIFSFLDGHIAFYYVIFQICTKLLKMITTLVFIQFPLWN